MLRFHHEEWLVIGEMATRGYVVVEEVYMGCWMHVGVIFIFIFYISLFLSVF